MKLPNLPVHSFEDATYDFETLQKQLVSNTVVSSLPATAVNGDEITLIADGTNGIAWRFKYRAGSASTFKWEFVGGSALYAEVDTNQSSTAVTFGDLATVGPSVTLPTLPNGGDFVCEWGYQYQAASLGGDSYTAIGINGTAQGTALSPGAAISEGGTNQPASALFVAWRKRTFTSVPGGATIKIMYRGTTGNATTFWNRQLFVTPVRVG